MKLVSLSPGLTSISGAVTTGNRGSLASTNHD